VSQDSQYNLTFESLDPFVSYKISYFAQIGQIDDYKKWTNVETYSATTKKYVLSGWNLAGFNSVFILVLFVFIGVF